MKYAHLIYTGFTGRKSYGFRGQEWFDHRIEVFKNYVVRNLLNQTSQNFTHWISFRPQERKNPSAQKLEQYLKNINYNFIFTFDGLLDWNKGVPNDDLPPRLEKTLPQLKHLVEGTDYVYMTHLDSDDMISKGTIQCIQEYDLEKFEERRVFVFSHGYVYDILTGEMAVWNSPCPAIFILMYPTDVFLDPQKHLDYILPYKYKNHHHIPKIYNSVVIPHTYCSTVHGQNITTIWNHKYRGENVKEINQFL